jgi:hypothetical protein
MELTKAQQATRDRYFQTLVAAVMPLKEGPDPELTLELLIDATGILHERLEKELEEIRLEQVE